MYMSVIVEGFVEHTCGEDKFDVVDVVGKTLFVLFVVTFVNSVQAPQHTGQICII